MRYMLTRDPNHWLRSTEPPEIHRAGDQVLTVHNTPVEFATTSTITKSQLRDLAKAGLEVDAISKTYVVDLSASFQGPPALTVRLPSGVSHVFTRAEDTAVTLELSAAELRDLESSGLSCEPVKKKTVKAEKPAEEE